jgi:hypothetical protein
MIAKKSHRVAVEIPREPTCLNYLKLKQLCETYAHS